MTTKNKKIVIEHFPHGSNFNRHISFLIAIEDGEPAVFNGREEAIEFMVNEMKNSRENIEMAIEKGDLLFHKYGSKAHIRHI